jgi:protein-S-isoprenylcysteine O-methyltransferase Ste14
MSLIPAFEIGLWNAWIFMIVFPLQWLAVLIVPSHVAERTGYAREMIRTRRDSVNAFLTQALWVGATLYSIFLPLHIGTVWFYAGLFIFIIGVIILITASINVYRTAPGEPFTEGMYRLSRHPMYLSMIVVYLSVSIAAASWLFFLITIATYFLQRWQMIREEEYCCEKFGRSYCDYRDRTPRWIGIPVRKGDE